MNANVNAGPRRGARVRTAKLNILTNSKPTARKVATGLMKPGKIQTANGREVAIAAPEEALELFDENAETESGILLGPYFPQSLKGEFIKRWKGIVTGQAFTGSYLELYAMQWLNRSVATDLIDVGRRVASGPESGVFQHLFFRKQNENSKRLYLKAKFSLADVNSVWPNLRTHAKGKDDVEPDIIMWSKEPNPQKGNQLWPTVSIIEMKIGLGKNDAGEWNQLCRLKKTFEIWLDQISRQRPNWLLQHMEQGWQVPQIKMYFVGWAAPSSERVVLVKPTNTYGYYNQNELKWKVTPLNGADFGALTGIRASFVSKIIQELNHNRAKAFYTTMSEFMDPSGRFHQQYKNSFNRFYANYNAELLRAAPNFTPIRQPGLISFQNTRLGAAAAAAGRNTAKSKRKAPPVTGEGGVIAASARQVEQERMKRFRQIQPLVPPQSKVNQIKNKVLRNRQLLNDPRGGMIRVYNELLQITGSNYPDLTRALTNLAANKNANDPIVTLRNQWLSNTRSRQ